MSNEVVLVIEDDSGLRAIIGELLRLEGYEVALAENGLEGVKLARERRPGIILCDAVMPVMDGFEVIRALRADETTAMIPVIVMTARIDRGNIRQIEETGAAGFLPKPFEPDELFALLSRPWDDSGP